MKRKFLNIISCFLSLFIFVGSFVFNVPSCVSAASSFPDLVFSPSVNVSVYEDVIDDLKSNDSFTSLGDCYVLLNCGSRVDVMIFKDFTSTQQLSSPLYGLIDCFFPSQFGYFLSIDYDYISDFNFSLHSFSLSNTSDRCLGVVAGMSFDYMGVGVNSSYQIYDHNPNFYCFFSSIIPPFNPDYDSVPLPFFSLEVDGFYDWIINNNKLSELPSYIVQAKLKSFIEFYKHFGSSNSFFTSKIVDWFDYMNIPNQSLNNISALKSATDKLYQEYINYRSGTHAYWPGATKIQERDSIDTKTDNNDTTLITDDSNDTIIISILRDILRGVIAISNNINQGVSNIIIHLEQLQFSVNVVNDGGISNIDLTPILNKLDDIIEALGSDTVSVEIDQTTKDDTDDFFDDWNLQFSTALNNKFPVASQLRTFFTGFFERCGIDADSDGEVYQYYNPGVLTASSVSRSAGTASEYDIVSDFLGQFGNSDPAFLDDASFHGVPDLSVSVGGQSVSIIDFRVYAKYRDKIHFIISFVIWTLYLLHLYKALPSIIGQVADVATKTSEL